MQIRWNWETVVFGLAAPFMVLTTLGLTNPSNVQGQAWAQDSTPESPNYAEPPEAVEPAPISEESDAVADSFDSYTYEDLFSVGVPSGWQTITQADSPQVILSSPDEMATQTENIRTEITWFNQPPEVIVTQMVNTVKENGYRVSRYETQGIDGTTALNIWIADLPEDLPNAFMTYIGYADSTAGVVSYYNATEPGIEALLSSIHESFQRLE